LLKLPVEDAKADVTNVFDVRPSNTNGPVTNSPANPAAGPSRRAVVIEPDGKGNAIVIPVDMSRKVY